MKTSISPSFIFPSILWILAFVCSLYPVNAWQLELFGAAVLLTLGWSYTMLARDMQAGWKLPRAAVLVCAFAFWLLVVASVFWSEVKPVSLMGLCFFSVLPLTFFCSVMAGKEAFFKTVGYALAGIFALLALWAMFQFFFLNAYFGGQARHPLADPSSLGALFSLGLFAALGWILSDRPASERRFAVVLASLLVCGIISSVARGPVFALLPALILFLVMLKPQVKLCRKALLIVLACGVAYYGVTLTGIQKQVDLGQRLFDTVSLQMNDVTNNRLAIWKGTWQMIKDHPLLGTGIGSFYQYYPEYQPPEDNDETYLAHSDPLQFWVELGVLGPLLFYAFIIAAAMRTFAALKKTKGDKEKASSRIVIVTVFCALLAAVVHTHVSFNFYNLNILMLIGLMLAVWFITTGRVLGEEARVTAMPSGAPALNKILLALPFLMTGWLFASLIGGEHFVDKARDELYSQQMMPFANSINQAERISLGMNSRLYLFAVNVPMAILTDRQSTLLPDQQKNLYDQVVGYMNKVLRINPRTASAYYYLARVQDLVKPEVIPGGTKSQEEFYKEALKIEPLHLGARLALYKLYRAQGKSNDELLAVMEPGRFYFYINPLAMEYYQHMANLYLEDGNMVMVQDIMGHMAEFKKRAQKSAVMQNTSIPQAIRDGGQVFDKQ